ncbi:MAG: tetratricopeptide repeat protein [Acidimicrobiia bacterium]
MAFASVPTHEPRRRPGWALIGFGIGIALSAIAWMVLGGAREPKGVVEGREVDAAGSTTAGRAGGPFPRSVQDLQDHLRQNPGDWRAWAALGVGYVDEARATGNPSLYPNAEGALDRSLLLRPDGNVAALAGRGALANARHDFAAGLRFADEASALDSADPGVAAVRGDALIELGRYDEAFDAYQRLVDLAPGIASYTRSGYALDLQGDVAGATRSLQLALGEAFAPQDLAFTNFSLGELAWNSGDLDTARRHYQRAAGADPDAVGPKAGLAPWALAAVGLGAGTALVYPTLLAAIGDVAHPTWRASAVGVYRLWRDSGYAIGALIAGITADLIGLRGAVAVVAALTAASGLLTARLLTETHRRS